jgi:hypothetical protein
MWVTVTKFPNYEINIEGQVRSKLTGRILKTFDNGRGYLTLRATTEDGKQRHLRVHRAVAEAFIPNPDSKPVVNHKDGNKKNNHVSNLEWVTFQENTIHAYEHGLFKKYKEV